MIENNKIKEQILEMMNTLLEAGEYIPKLLKDNNFDETFIILNEMITMLQSINRFIGNNDYIEENRLFKLDAACESIIYSLNRIKKLLNSRSSILLNKFEFETIPLIQEMKSSYYFWEYIFKENENFMNPENERIMTSLRINKYIENSEKNNDYKYDLSIVIIAYNKLEYTKMCIESILKYVPKDLNYELILLNHGSSDGTKEYFESILPTKQMDILKNGSGASAVHRVIEGKYFLSISNDVLVTPNAISNMLKCIQSDSKIAWVVPSTPNISNCQNIDVNYNNISELFEFCKKNNLSDKYRWEHRSRLCNPIDLQRSKDICSYNQIMYLWYYYSKIGSFPDDKRSLLLRRNGYKMMLAKDAYCYHFGSVTLKDETDKHKDKEGNIGQEAFYNEGRKEFYSTFGIDPWGTGFCWAPVLFEYLPCNDNEHVDVLGINCGIGSNPLKVKESIKENVHNLDVITYNVTDEKCYIEDLKGVSDFAEYINSCSNIDCIFDDKKFKYIIFESKLETYEDPLLMISNLKKRLVEDGIIAIKTLDEGLQNKIKNKYLNAIQSQEWIILK